MHQFSAPLSFLTIFCKGKLRNHSHVSLRQANPSIGLRRQRPSKRPTIVIPKTINKKLVTPSKESPDHVFIRKSPSVPTPTGTNCGRDTLYQIDIIASPRYVSMRNEQECLVSDEVVKELTKLFGGVSLDSSVTSTEEEFKADESKSSSFDDEEKSTVGRFDDKVFSKKAKGEVKVKRSFRLADDKNKM